MTLAERIARAIALLESNGYKVTKKVPRGKPRTVDRKAIQDVLKKLPDITNAEGAAIVGCSVDAFSKIRRGER